MQTTSPRPNKPGSGIIDLYMPTAAPDEQEAAYENLVSLSKLLACIDDRLVEEEEEMKQTIQPPPFL
jgi:hypothetical protein